ncbi:MAG: SMP-30/gluconolactonase/LRE family protein [Balneolales bacterium]
MPLASTDASLELQSNAILGEGPVWDERAEKLYWVDILSHKLFIYDPVKHTNDEYDTVDHIGAFSLREQGGLVMATKTGFAFFDPETRKRTHITDPESDIPDNRFNDGKSDSRGRFWAGTMSYEVKKKAGSLYCLNPDLSVDVKLQGVTISNGLVWNKQLDKFYFIDTPTRKIFSFDYEDKTGGISNRQVIKELKEGEGYPDGMTIDTEDHLWVALYGGSKILRIDPITGRTVFEIHLPVPQVTSCTFGGSQLNELYITTCRENMSEQEIRKAPLSGSLFRAKVPFQGMPLFRFKG